MATLSEINRGSGCLVRSLCAWVSGLWTHCPLWSD